MALFKKISNGMLYKGGIFGTGVLGVYLWRTRLLPQYMGIISMGVTAIGLCSTLWDAWKGDDAPKQDSYNTECKEIVDVLYRKVVEQAEEQASQRESEDGIEEQEGERQIANEGNEPAGTNQTESKLPAVPNEANTASAVGSSLRACAANFSQNIASEAGESKVDELAAGVLEVPILEDDVDEALARQLAIEELDAKPQKTKDVCEEEGAVGGSTSDSRFGEVFHGFKMSKISDTNRPGIRRDLTLREEILQGSIMNKFPSKRKHT